MIVVIISFLGAIVSATMILLILNYSIYLWESRKIQDLSSQIKSGSKDRVDDILEKHTADRGFTTRDASETVSKSSSKSIQPINNEERKVFFVDSPQEKDFIKQITSFFKGLRLNFWSQIRSFVNYLIHLTKPSEDQKEEPKNEEILQKQTEVAEVIKKVQTQEEDKKEIPAVAPENQVVVVNPKKSTETKDEKEEKLFEKLENNLLNKLKEIGMKHFDIWLDLGNLYVKYKEPEKAREIYALVLKNAEGREKEEARNRLIEIS